MTSPREGMMEVNDYVEFPNETGKYWLGIGKIAGTYDLYMTRFVKTAHPTGLWEEGDKNEGLMERHTYETRTMGGGQYSVSKDETIPIKERYVKMLHDQWHDFVLVKRDLAPLVKDFKCITS